jgi:hypothetical protein
MPCKMVFPNLKFMNGIVNFFISHGFFIYIYVCVRVCAHALSFPAVSYLAFFENLLFPFQILYPYLCNLTEKCFFLISK